MQSRFDCRFRKAIDVARGESFRDTDLVVAQNVYSEVKRALEDRMRKGLSGEAPEDERRIERDRREGADGQAVWLPIRLERRYDGHSCGSAAKGRASITIATPLRYRFGDAGVTVGRIDHRPRARLGRSGQFERRIDEGQRFAIVAGEIISRQQPHRVAGVVALVLQ